VSTRVVLVDDQELLRAGLAYLLAAEEDLEVVGQAADGQEALALVERTRPDVVLMDLRMEGGDGLTATRHLTSRPDPPRVLVLTTFDSDDDVYSALKAGASGFLVKDADPRQLADAVRTVARGDSLLSPAITRRLVERHLARPPQPAAVLPDLTARETDVLRLVARGRSNREIAAELYLAETTVKTHLGRVMAKTGCRDRVQAVILAYDAGLVRPHGDVGPP
jgi:DNA-binding NarL/FixJ family response regulator